jgi:hypothetical protein
MVRPTSYGLSDFPVLAHETRTSSTTRNNNRAVFFMKQNYKTKERAMQLEQKLLKKWKFLLSVIPVRAF